MDGRPPRSVRKVPARHADHSRNNSSGGAACRGTVRFCGRARIETIVAETGRLGEKRAPDGLWIFNLKSKSSSMLLARRFCRKRKTTPRAAVVMIASQVLHSLCFFTDQCQGAALVPAADSVAASELLLSGGGWAAGHGTEMRSSWRF